MQAITGIIGAGFVASLLLVTSAQAADDLDALRADLGKHRTAEAWALAEKLNAQHAGDPEYDLLYARAALAAGRASEAVFALERVRLQRPEHEVAWLLLVRAHIQSGDPVHARRELDALLASGISKANRTEAQRLDARLGLPATSRARRGFIGLDVGYDSNVNSATDAVSVTGIGGSPTTGFILAPGDRAQRDSLVRLSAGYGGKRALGSQGSLFADVSGYANALYDQTQFNTSLYQGRVGASWQAGPHRLALPFSRQVFSVDHRRYSTYDAAALEWTYTLSAAQRLVLAASRGLGSYVNQPTRDARSTAALLGWRALVAGRARLGVNARYGQDDPRIDFNETLLLSSAFMGRRIYALGLDARYSLWPRHEPRFGVVYQGSRHDGVDPDFVVVRHDQYAYVVAGWDWRVWPDWMLSAEVNHAANRSNIDLYDFDKTQVLLGVRHDFH
jgi:hypothetical protein